MKKNKLILIVLNIIIPAIFTYSLFMVWNDRLLYLNSILGYVLAKTYRFSIIAFIILLIFDFGYCFFSIKKKKIPKASINKKADNNVKRQMTCPACGASKQENALFCGECGYKF